MSTPTLPTVPVPVEENGRIITRADIREKVMPIHFGLRNLVEVNAQAPIPEMIDLLRVIHRAIRDALPGINAALPAHVPPFKFQEEGELL